MDIEAETDVRQFVVACRSLAGEIEEPKKITGIVVRPYERPRDDTAAVQVYNLAFAGQWSYNYLTPADWREKMGASHVRLNLSWVAEPVEARGRLVGVSICVAPDDQPPCTCKEAWVDIIGTAPTWQARGIGRVLMLHSLRSMKDAGYAYAVLGVDSECEPVVRKLYQSVGFRVPPGSGRADRRQSRCWCASAGVFVSS